MKPVLSKTFKTWTLSFVAFCIGLIIVNFQNCSRYEVKTLEERNGTGANNGFGNGAATPDDDGDDNGGNGSGNGTGGSGNGNGNGNANGGSNSGGNGSGNGGGGSGGGTGSGTTDPDMDEGDGKTTLKVSPANPIVGDSVTFSIEDTEAPADTTFNWFFSPGNSSTVNLLHSSASRSYTIPNAQIETHQGKYWVERTSSRSNKINLTVTNAINLGPKIFIDNLIGQITDSLIVASSTRDMISDDSNNSFRCLQNNTNCSQESGANRTINHVYKTDGSLLIDDGSIPTVGTTLDRQRCNTFSATPSTADCPIKVTVKWEPKCPESQTSCENKDLIHNFKITGEYRVPTNSSAPPVEVQVPVDTQLMKFDNCTDISNGTGIKLFTLLADKVSKNYYCLLRSCKEGYSPSVDQKSCLTNSRIRIIPHGKITEVWNGSSYVFNSILCDTTPAPGYHPEGQECRSNILIEPIPHGTRTSYWTGTTYVFDHVSCDTDFVPSRDKRECVAAPCVNASWSQIKTESANTCNSSCQIATYRECIAGNSCGLNYCIGAVRSVDCKRYMSFGYMKVCIEPVTSNHYTVGAKEQMGLASCRVGEGSCKGTTTCTGDMKDKGISPIAERGPATTLENCRIRCGKINASGGYWHKGTKECVCGTSNAVFDNSQDQCNGCRAFVCRKN